MGHCQLCELEEGKEKDIALLWLNDIYTQQNIVRMSSFFTHTHTHTRMHHAHTHLHTCTHARTCTRTHNTHTLQVVTGATLGEVAREVICNVRFPLLDPAKLSQVEKENQKKEYIPVR